MQKWHAHDPVQTGDLPWDQPEREVQAVPNRPIENLYRPKHRYEER